MNWDHPFHEVKSTNIEKISYDPQGKVLRVKFHHGGEYDYAEVPPKIFEGFKDADSPGAYLKTKVKGSFGFRKVEKE